VGASDAVIAAAILFLTGWWLWRAIRTFRAGGCHGCSGGCRDRPAPAAAKPLVRIGGARR
jgi:hypothetical protein